MDADLNEGRAGEALLERGGDVAAAAEIEASPASGARIPREAGVEEGLSIAGCGGAVRTMLTKTVLRTSWKFTNAGSAFCGSTKSWLLVLKA